MAEDGNVHPGSFVGDTIEEFRKLPTWGKVLAGLLFIGVAYLGYSQYVKGKSLQPGVAGSTTDTTGTGAGGGTNIGGVPVIPSGYQSVYNPTTGVLEGYQPGQPPITGGQNQPPTSNPPLQGGNPPVGGQAFTNPLIPSGQYKGPSFSNLKPGTQYTYNGTTYTLNTGGGGRLYGTPVGSNQQVLLYGPPSQYHSIASPAVVTPGGQNGATQVPTSRVS
jgi:hypothetical protein